MKILTQVIGSGACSVIEAPPPKPLPGTVVVQSHASLISSGTETMLLDFGRSSLLNKIRSQPDRAKQVVEKAVTDGLVATIAAVRDKLGDTVTPGYCQAGVVVQVGDAAGPFVPGDRVVTNGPHAETVRVPYNLAARIPPGVDFETAAFTPLGAIALHGLRQARPTLGETIVVFGLGLVGQLAVQLVRAHGCRCIGIDTDPQRVCLAQSLGAIGLVAGDTPIVNKIRELTGGVGADAVLMTLATDSDVPMHEAAEMSRKRGRIVLVGVTGLHLRRADFYEKELSFKVSCSYGPGRYDPDYEEEGNDYPLAFVRWTEQRNFEAVLGLMADGSLDATKLVSHRFPIEDAPAAYDLLLSEQSKLGILLTYGRADERDVSDSTIALRVPATAEPGTATAGVIGAGNFARRTLLPAAQSAGIRIRTIVSTTGVAAAIEGRRAGADFAGSDALAVLDDPEIDTVFILTRHDSHAELVVRALDAGKHVFVEKPLALKLEHVEAVRSAHESSQRVLTVGFNRRFAPLTTELKEIVDRRTGPVSLIITVNAGHVDLTHWIQDKSKGGGRIVGEACHFIDLARYLVGSPIAELRVQPALGAHERILDDVSHLVLGFDDGSTAAVHYLATGARQFPKERVEAFFDGKTAAIDNWRKLRTWGLGRRDRLFPRRMDKGHVAELRAFAASVRAGGPPPIPIQELFDVSLWSIRAAELASAKHK